MCTLVFSLDSFSCWRFEQLDIYGPPSEPSHSICISSQKFGWLMMWPLFKLIYGVVTGNGFAFCMVEDRVLYSLTGFSLGHLIFNMTFLYCYTLVFSLFIMIFVYMKYIYFFSIRSLLSHLLRHLIYHFILFRFHAGNFSSL